MTGRDSGREPLVSHSPSSHHVSARPPSLPGLTAGVLP